ncbi:MAG: glycerophosphodiester phosphodiesterase [Candidatus Binatia bacterium]
MDIVGHRGACGHAPENTLKSFAKAIELGCQRVELDVHVSADGAPVVIHDETLDRTTNGKGSVRTLTLAELEKLDAGGGERIPALAEVMELCRGKVALQIELKDSTSPPLVAQLIEKEWDRKRVVVTSFNLSLLDEFATLIPDIPLGLLNRNPALDMIATAKEHGHRWICPRFNIVSHDLVNRAHDVGLLVYVYHVNQQQIAEDLILWRVDAVGTDYPELVSGLLVP